MKPGPLNLERLEPSLVWLGAAGTAGLPLVYVAGWGVHQPNPANWLILCPYYLTGLFVVRRRPKLLPARLLLAAGTSLVLAGAIGEGLAVAYRRYGDFAGFWALNMLERFFELGFAAAWVALFAVFPDGFFQRGYERVVVRLCVAVMLAGPFLTLISHRNVDVDRFIVWGKPKVAGPLYVHALSWAGWIPAPFYQDLLAFPALAVILMLLRFRRFGREERLQMSWPLGGIVVFALIPGVPFPGGENTSLVILGVLYSVQPVAIAIGLLRHRLFDIEVPVRKSISFGLLWLLITGLAGGAAAAVGIGLGLSTASAVVLAVAVLLLFQPLRARLEQLASRRIYGERPSGYALLGQLGATLESAYQPSDLLATLATAIRQGLGVTWVRITHESAVAADGIRPDRPATPEASAPLQRGDAATGSIECGPKVNGRFEQADLELLETLGRQAALALDNARLSAELSQKLVELASSRQRIVQAAEVERRRIERNIHDGIQQELVALMARLGLARNQLQRHPELVEATLDDLRSETEQALEHLRELARGIHPAVLSDRGLLEAVEARLAGLTLGVKVDADRSLRGARYPEPVEGAAYFFLCESLANVLKHAAARNVVVRIEAGKERLSVAVEDDGCGFDARHTSGSGLRGLRDRIEALSGAVEIASTPGAGTRVAASLPISGGTDG